MASDSTSLRQVRLMARYNQWVDERLYELAAGLSDEERKRDLGAFFHSVHRTLNHLLLTDRHWMSRFAACTPYRFRSLERSALEPVLGEHGRELFAEFDRLREEHRETAAALAQWTRELTPEMLDAPMRYANSKGVVREHPLWFAVAHLFNHQTHHRSQATTMMQQLGVDYGVTDLLAIYQVDPGALMDD